MFNKILKNHTSRIVVLISIVTLVLTPWWNVDSLVIPKLIVLFAVGTYYLPYLLFNYKEIFKTKKLVALSAISLLILLQYIFVMLLSESPIEQQIYGKTGRGLGLITEASLLILMITVALLSRYKDINTVLTGVIISSTVSSIYSILQYFGVDLFAWSTRTNGIIGTLGNPNFQAVLAAIGFLPTILFVLKKNMKLKVFLLIFLGLQIFTVYICESFQGYILVLLSAFIFILLYIRDKLRIIYYGLLSFGLFFGLLFVAALTNRGALASQIFDRSVQSRLEFWTTAFNTTKDNILFGVGIDSFGDVSSFYKNKEAVLGVNEFTDSAHNYFLQYSATGGIPLALLYLSLSVMVFVSFLRFQKVAEKFDAPASVVFSIWACLQAQSLINPGSIPLMAWNSLVGGFIVCLSISRESNLSYNRSSVVTKPLFLPFSYFLVFVSFISVYPLFNSDKASLDSLKKGDAQMAVAAAKMFPESTLRYSRIGVELLKSNLPEQALEVGRAAVEFNPKALSAWALILANNSAPLVERELAKEKILELDPFNDDIRALKLP